MSIKDRQILTATQQMLESQLRKGVYPNLSSVQNLIAQLFEKQPAGLPRFQHQAVEQYAVSDPDSYNASIDAIHDDLWTAFQEVGYHTDRMLAIANTYETEKKRVHITLKNLENRISLLSQKLTHWDQRVLCMDTFDTFDQVQLNGIASQGIPGTDAFVDLKTGQVTLEKNYANAMKHNLAKINSTIKVTKGTGKGKEITSLQNALKDTINQVWRYKVTSTKAESIQITVLLELPEIITLSDVTMILHSPRETTVQLSISKDNQAFKAIGTYRSYDFMQWQVSEEARYIQFTMLKEEPDYVDGTTYEYHFGAQNISASNNVYLSKGTFVSQPYLVENKVIDKIILEADDVIFPQTDIHYYVGIDNLTDFVEWQEVQSGKELSLNTLQPQTMKLENGSAGYGALVTTEFGIPYYKIGSTLFTPAETMNLRMGANMWQVDMLSATRDAAYLPMLSDWLDARGASTKFVPLELTMSGGTFGLTQDSLQRFTVYVYCSEATSILNNELNIGSSKGQVYLNNTLLKPIVTGGVYKYNYHFAAGWNKLQILTNTRGPAAVFQPNLYLKSIAALDNDVSLVYAIREPMKQVSLYDLYNNTSKKDLSRFALDGNTVIVNHDPKGLDISGAGIKYTAAYSYAPGAIPLINRVRMMAVLSRSDSNLQATPILRSYQLTLK